MASELTRRQTMAGLAGAALVAAALPAHALDTARAEQIINQVVSEIQAIINSGRSEAQMYADFERVFEKYADVDTIARFTLGPDARAASASEMRAYTDAFAGYMARKYGKRFREFIGGQIEVRSAREIRGGFAVETTTNLRGRAPFEVVYLVSNRSGRDAFYDMVVEGVSLLKSEAVEIRAMLDRNRGSIPGLVQDLNRAG